ncbi:MAG TPA: glycosyl transferase [Verrucomicrobiales bacterium]|nr:glycosyl transferase [Verrucomicrobiales bacterium]
MADVKTQPSLLLLIPAYNEEERIGPVLRGYAEYFRANYDGEFRAVVVLNGCRDNTIGIVKDAAREFPEIEPLNFKDSIGKGGALIEGFKRAIEAEVVLTGYVDADGATSAKALHELIKHYEAGESDCVIGSRWLPQSVLHQNQTKLRRIFSRGFHVIVELLFWLGIKDTQCPAKLVRREALEEIIESLRIADLAFDVNLLVSLKRKGYKIEEMPIEWTDQLGSKVTANLWRVSLIMFLSVVRLRLIYSPFYAWLRPLRPLETWLYLKLNAPPPRSRSKNA